MSNRMQTGSSLNAGLSKNVWDCGGLVLKSSMAHAHHLDTAQRKSQSLAAIYKAVADATG